MLCANGCFIFYSFHGFILFLRKIWIKIGSRFKNGVSTLWMIIEVVLSAFLIIVINANIFWAIIITSVNKFFLPSYLIDIETFDCSNRSQSQFVESMLWQAQTSWPAFRIYSPCNGHTVANRTTKKDTAKNVKVHFFAHISLNFLFNIFANWFVINKKLSIYICSISLLIFSHPCITNRIWFDHIFWLVFFFCFYQYLNQIKCGFETRLHA